MYLYLTYIFQRKGIELCSRLLYHWDKRLACLEVEKMNVPTGPDINGRKAPTKYTKGISQSIISCHLCKYRGLYLWRSAAGR